MGPIRTSPYSTLCFLHTACSDTATKYNANKNASQFTIADDHDDNASVSSGISGSGKRRGKSQFESSVVIGDDTDGRLGDNDPVGRSRNNVKTSSRYVFN